MRPLALWIVVAALGLGLAYSPVLASDGLLSFDDPNVVQPMAAIHSLADYLRARDQGRIVDVQPLRDLSFWLNFRLRDATGVALFHLTNLLLWLGAVVLLGLSALELGLGPPLAGGLMLWLAWNPIFVSAVAWISARKHVLAALFTLLATWLLLRLVRAHREGRRLGWLAAGVGTSYLLACASQPIAVGWPLFAALYLLLEERALLRRPAMWGLFALLAAGMAGGTAWNLRYYTSAYVERFGASKFSDTDGLSWKLQALGRDFFQLVLPVRPAVWDHDPFSPLGWVGLALLALAVGLGAWLRLRAALPWAALFALVLAPLLVRLTNVFCTDQYLLLPGAAWALVAGLMLQRWPHPRLAFGLAAPVLLLCLFSGHRVAEAWSDNERLWRFAYETEPTPKNTKEWAGFLLRRGEPKEAQRLAQQAWDADPTMRGLGFVYSKAVYVDPTLAPAEKRARLRSHPSGWSTFFLAMLDAEQGQPSLALRGMEEVLRLPPPELHEFASDAPVIGAQLRRWCEAAREAGCAEREQRFLRETGAPGAP